MKKSLKYELLFRICLIMVILSVLSCAGMYYAYSSMLTKEAIKDSMIKVDRLSNTLGNSFDDLFQFSNYISSNSTIQDYFKKSENISSQENVYSITKMSTYLKNLFFTKNYIHSIALMNKNDEMLWTLSPYDNYFGEKLKNELYPKTNLIDVKGFTRKYLLPMKQQNAKKAEVISYFSNIFIINYGYESHGKLIINIELSSFLNNIMASKNDFDNIGLYDEYGELLYFKSQDASISLKDSSGNMIAPGKVNGGYRFVSVVPKCNWTIVSFINQSNLLKEVNYSTLIILITSFLLGVILISLLILPKILNAVKQITTLNGGMKNVSKGRLDTHINLNGAQEFIELSEGFNHMTTEIKRYMTESIRNLEEKQHISFELLFAQFNPHFIYNTLNSVIYIARQKRCDDIIEMISAFIFLLQDAIHSSGGNIFNSVEVEISTVNKYIIIQKYRYINRFDVEISVDESLKDVLIPKSVLQPLVENSIIHGICPMTKKGMVYISITETADDKMLINIRDNGIGMDSDLINKILNQNKKYNSNNSSLMLRSIGIGNIINELKYLYSDNYSFNIESQPNIGTQITIILPKNPPPVVLY
ncbi:MAG: sensor histidine kinase [Ruminiclostridium sp.]